MKKIAFLLLALVLMFTGCGVDDAIRESEEARESYEEAKQRLSETEAELELKKAELEALLD